MKNTPTLSPAEKFSEFLLILIHAIVAQAGVKLPPATVAMIEAELREIGENFARLAASIEKGEPLPSRQERRTSRSAAPRQEQAQKSPLPRRERPHTAGAPQPATSATQPRFTGLRASRGPPKFDPDAAQALARLYSYDYETL